MHSFLLYLHNILYTKSVYSHICILNLHAYQILLDYFSLFNIPLFEICCIPVEFPTTYEYGLDSILLLLYLFLFCHINPLIFFLYLVLTFHKLLVSYIWEQILRDTYNSRMYVINYFYPFRIPPFSIYATASNINSLSREVFCFKLKLYFSTTSIAGGLFMLKRTKKDADLSTP